MARHCKTPLSPLHWESRKCNEKTRKVQPIIVMRKQKIHLLIHRVPSYFLSVFNTIWITRARNLLFTFISCVALYTRAIIISLTIRKNKKQKTKKRALLVFESFLMSFEKSEWRQYFFPLSFLFSLILFRRYVLCCVSHRALPALENPFLILRHSTMLSNANAVPINNTFKAIDYALPYIYTSASSSGRRPPRRIRQRTKEECIWLDIEIYFTCLMQTNRTQTRCWRYRRPQAFDINNRGKISKFSSTTGGSDLTAISWRSFVFPPS